MAEGVSVENKSGLNEQQLQMLSLFKKPMAEEDFNEIRRTVVKVLARNIDVQMDILEKERGWSTETYEQWGNEHLRSPYKK